MKSKYEVKTIFEITSYIIAESAHEASAKHENSIEDLIQQGAKGLDGDIELGDVDVQDHETTEL